MHIFFWLSQTWLVTFDLGCTVPPDSKETELGSSNQEAFPLAGKKNRVVFSATFAHGSASLQLFLVVRIFLRSLGVICYNRWVLSEGYKNYFKDCCLMNSQSTFQFVTDINSMKSLAWWIFEAFVQIFLIVDPSLNQTLLTFLLFLRQTWVTQLILLISP